MRSIPLDSYLRELSGGRVIAASPSGPVFSDEPIERRVASGDSFVWALTQRGRVAVALVSLAWLATLVTFVLWWSAPEHRLGTGTFVLNTFLLFYIAFVPGYFVVAANRLRKVRPDMAIPNVRVAMVTTKAPAEPWSLVRTTLEAMLTQQFPYSYDVWLADEAPDEDVISWCDVNGIQISTRAGVAEYQRTAWPRRRRCKEGNLAFFYDHYGYANYDVVSQLDADHVPDTNYLAEMVRPFADAAIGYVAAPSVCGANADRSWAVRGRLYREALFHGPHQLGHNHGMGPVAIGSHYAVRTAALREIGGLGPELAEDFSTSYLLNVAGWSGAFAIDANANGDGPDTLAAMLTQEFQWSRSLTTCALSLVPRTIGRIGWRLRLRFGFAILYYPMLWLTSMLGVLLAPIAAVTAVSWVRVNYGYFLLFWIAVNLQIFVLAYVMKRNRLLRPTDAPLLNWEQWVHVVTRWPFVGFGVLAAMSERFRSRPLDFKVTPKRDGTREPIAAKIFVPFLVITLGLSGSAIYGAVTAGPIGYVALTVLGSIGYVTATTTFVARHAIEAVSFRESTAGQAVRLVWMPLLGCVVAGLALLVGTGAFAQYVVVEFGL